MLTRRELLAKSACAAAGLTVGKSAANRLGVAAIMLPPDPMPLESAVARITEQSGEPLGVGADCRWDGVQVGVTNRPAARVNVELAELLNYAWIDEQPKPVLKAGA